MPVLEEVTLQNRALTRIGASPIFSTDEETPKARSVVAVWDDRVESILSMHAWSFAKKTYLLDRLDLEPVNGFKRAFALPGTRLGPPIRLFDDPAMPELPLRRFAMEEDVIFCDEEKIFATVKVRPAVTSWHPLFRELVVVAVAAALAIPISRNRTLAAELDELAFGLPSEGGRGGMFATAMNADVSGNPQGAPLLAADPLTSARF